MGCDGNRRVCPSRGGALYRSTSENTKREDYAQAPARTRDNKRCNRRRYNSRRYERDDAPGNAKGRGLTDAKRTGDWTRNVYLPVPDGRELTLELRIQS